MARMLLLYLLWAIIVFLLTFLQGGSTDNVAHIFILLFFALQFPAIVFLRKIYSRFSPRAGFVILSTLFACVVEGLYLFVKPVFPSLLITFSTPLGQMLANYAIDLLFTVPVYVAVFLVIWHFINKYEYALWEYVVFVSFGQAIGDGIAFFLFAPVMLLFLPYVMVNYQAMNVVPFILSGKEKTSAPSLKKYLVPVISIIAIYLAGGLLIKVVGSFFGFS